MSLRLCAALPVIVLMLLIPGPVVASAPVPQGDVFPVNSLMNPDQQAADVALDAAGNATVVWTHLDTVDGRNLYVTYLRRFDRVGAALDTDVRVDSGTEGGFGPQVARSAAGISLVTWAGTSDSDPVGIYARRFTSAGVPEGPIFGVNTTVPGNQASQDMAMNQRGAAVITWRSQLPDTYTGTIYAQLYAPDGTPQGGEIVVSTPGGDDYQPSAAIDASGRVFIVWYCGGILYGRRIAADGRPAGDPFSLSFTRRNDTFQDVAMDAAGNALVVWQRGGFDYKGGQIWAQRVSRSGDPLGVPFLVNTTLAAYNGNPKVAMDPNGNATVVWVGIEQENGDGSVYGRRIAPDGSLQGDELAVSTERSPGVNAWSPSVAMSQSGSTVIAWHRRPLPGAVGTGIYARRYAVPEVQLAQSDGATRVRRGGSGDKLTIALSSIPTSTVSVTLIPSTDQLDLGRGPGQPQTLVFLADARALVPQTITVTAALRSGVPLASATLTPTVSSSDPSYTPTNVGITIDGVPETVLPVVLEGVVHRSCLPFVQAGSQASPSTAASVLRGGLTEHSLPDKWR